jgi:hypothetical protein
VIISDGIARSAFDKPLNSLQKKNYNRKYASKSSEPISVPTNETATVRIYIGMEYECPIGHRFICSGPDRVVKLSQNGIMKVKKFYSYI